MYPIINLDDINLSAPYFVYASSDNKSIKFTTDNTLHYTVSYIEDYNFPGAYQFFLYEDDKRKSSYDEKISLTILSILRSFFTDKMCCFLFVMHKMTGSVEGICCFLNGIIYMGVKHIIKKI